MRNWVNFYLSTEKSEKMYIDGLFLSKPCNVSVRKFQRNYMCHETEGCHDTKGKLACGLKNDTRNLVNFHASSQKSENLHSDWILLSKA